MKLIVMTQPDFFVEEDKILTSLFDKGMEQLLLFKPDSSPVYSERLLYLIPEEYHEKIYVHEHFYLKNECSLGGIYLAHEAQQPEHYKGNVCQSCHSIEQLRLAKKHATTVCLENVFDATPSETRSAYTQEELKEAAKQGIIDKKVYASGHLTLENINLAKEVGFGGLVVCEDLWKLFNIQHQDDYKELLQHFEKLKKAVS